MTIKVGERLQLQERVIAEVLENMEDGMWLQVRFLEVPCCDFNRCLATFIRRFCSL
jgi:hypothetical protein